MKLDNIKKPLLIVIAGILISVFVLFSGASDGTRSDEAIDISQIEIRKQLTKEFNDSYSRDVDAIDSIKEYELVAGVSSVEIVDGYSTEVWSYNEQVPGPTMRAKVGETLRIDFTNNLSQETTIHFHGIRVPNEMDGVPNVTQKPIAPGESFTYEFVPKDAGTFWYHPHVRGSEQVERGLYGVIVVEDDSDQLAINEKILVIDDWLLDEDGEIYDQFNTRHDLMHDGRWGNVITVNGDPEYRLDISSEEYKRLRIVNSSNGRIYSLDFGNLDAEVIAVDGMYVKETFNPSGFDLAPGNRLDVLVKAKDGEQSQDAFIVDRFFNNSNHIATVNVVDKSEEDTELSSAMPVDFTVESMPQWDKATKVNKDVSYVLDAIQGPPYGIQWVMNNEVYPNGEVYEFTNSEFVKAKFVNNSGRLHPMHLHGQFFKLVSRDGKYIDEGHWRDTVLIYPNETVEVGMVPLDKGEWANHCHILEHAEAGMMTTFKVT